ncbi:MAG TPA: hypothetical protein VGR63_04225 [Casimicrobiaceae bacterium]|jgi:hypothetical protein|nr:hypothetical protein [Casimicrobiaceae bacterium]
MPPYRPWFDDPQRRTDVVTIPLFWLALILSLLVHVAALWYFAMRQPVLLPGLEESDVNIPMSVRLAESRPASPPPSGAQPPPPPPPAASPPQRAPSVTRPRVPPVIAALPNVPSTERLPMAPEPIAPPTVSTPPEPMAGDLSSYIESQRRARGERPSQPSANPADDAEARRDRAIAANLASANDSPTYYGEPKNSGGVFNITYIGYDDAEFVFFGWIKEIRRRAPQKIEVRTGDNANIRIAIVRKMIDIIRQYEQGDFTWKSERIGHEVTLSARPGDQATLEDFLMRDFFDAQPPPDPRSIRGRGRAAR